MDASVPIDVLLVEDSDDDAALIAEELASGGYRANIRRVQTAEALRAALDDGRWDIVLSDYNLPAFSARDALSLVKASSLGIPFIVVSGYVGEETAVGLLKVGAHDFVAKHNLTRLVPSISRELHEARCREEQRRAGEELIESRQRLRDLSNFLQSVREDDRARIARELHDDLGQALTALKMDLSWMKARIPDDQPALTQKAEDMLEIIDSTVESVRRIAANLRPGLLDDLGLAAAVEWLVEDFSKRHSIACELHMVEDALDIPESLSITVFRLVQEALTNVARHARAGHVRVSLTSEAGAIRIEVSDDGRGFDSHTKALLKSYGLLGMRERVAALSGQMEIQSQVGQGTMLRVSLPLQAGRTELVL